MNCVNCNIEGENALDLESTLAISEYLSGSDSESDMDMDELIKSVFGNGNIIYSEPSDDCDD